jgi:hypothetical protein
VSEQADLPFKNYAPFAVIPKSMLDKMWGLNRGIVRTVLYLGTLARKPGEWVKISHRRLAELTGYAVDTVRRYIAVAERFGLLRRRYLFGDEGEQRCNEYQLVMTPSEAKAVDEKKTSPLRAAILHHADVFVAAWNRENEEIPFESAAQALASSATLPAQGAKHGQPWTFHKTCLEYVTDRIRGTPAFSGMRERAIHREAARIASG